MVAVLGRPGAGAVFTSFIMIGFCGATLNGLSLKAGNGRDVRSALGSVSHLSYLHVMV